MKFFYIFLSLLILFSIGSNSTPKRIVSLAPSITEELFLLGVGDRIVGVTIYCKYPEEARKKEKVGTILEPNIEKIVSLNPDLVLATKDANREITIENLRKLGLNVFVFDESKNFYDISQNFLKLGKLVNKEKEAKKILNEVEKEIEKICEKIKYLNKVKVFWEVGANPLVTVAKGTFDDEIITIAGGINIAHESKIRYPQYNLEKIVEQNPDVIILVSMGDVTSKEVETWKKFTTINAVKNNRIYIIDADIVCVPTPHRFVEGIKKVVSFLHPEVFKEKNEKELKK